MSRFKHASHLFENILVVVGVVLIWRGLWYMLDDFDLRFFGGSHLWTAAVGILVGLLILYIPDRDLKELGK